MKKKEVILILYSSSPSDVIFDQFGCPKSIWQNIFQKDAGPLPWNHYFLKSVLYKLQKNESKTSKEIAHEIWTKNRKSGDSHVL